MVKNKDTSNLRKNAAQFFEYLGYFGIVVGVIGIVLLLLKIGEVK